MRESNYTYPPQNRAVLTVTHLLYDRRGEWQLSLLLRHLGPPTEIIGRTLGIV